MILKNDDILKLRDELIENGIIVTERDLDEQYKLFREKFGPDVLKNLKGEELLEYVFDQGRKDTLNYWLEYKNDEEFQTKNFGSIAGGSALKFGIFKSKKTGDWIIGSTRKMKSVNINQAVKKAEYIKDRLLKGISFIENNLNNYEDSTYTELQEELDKILEQYSNYAWIHKYYHLLFPEKIDNFHVEKLQKFYLRKLKINFEEKKGLYYLSNKFTSKAKKLGIPTSHYTAVLLEVFGHVHNYWIFSLNNQKNDEEIMFDENYIFYDFQALDNLDNMDFKNKTDAKKYIQDFLISKGLVVNTDIEKKITEIVSFYFDIDINDTIVLLRKNRVLGIGKIKGPYEFKKNEKFQHSKAIKWEKFFDPSKYDLKINVNFSITKVNKTEDIIKIEKMFENSTESIKPKIDTSLILQKIKKVLERKKQVILYGPPGTGKTYWAEKTCLELASESAFNKSFNELNAGELIQIYGDNDSLVKFCTFHPSYGYEDFIEGIKTNIKNNQTFFSLKEGIFKKICKDANENHDKKYFLIIDEINRGDISRIFGELITLLEINKRGKKAILPLSGEIFFVPENVYIIATMNTADRSIALIDIALRRRFGFIELMPDYSIFSGFMIENLPLDKWLKSLNEKIIACLGKDARNLQIGHSYFMENGKPIKDFEKFKRVIQEDIIPLIEEYCYEDYEIIKKILGSSFIDIKNQSINYKFLEEASKEEFIDALVENSKELLKGD
ncbi:5-methylcytosine-specific restriction enzyme B [Marinitoga hydrogenitolerans DSM 16785]|uniref:5-methylcytosine-specific restriction enzyme B n=1 Tax=Marinitoga hydrogenitolerans (strain DSM 16785 / JCM 12826 / AT1271) TaxID=1122195 RepID=A0A1M4SQG3_MARH1|nr:AAA family ATPase [Marinitoga hydrogenitolerans]SHE34450.1 5-methylcytosine-specific restriction enzyme B [Marinitoga hydrogenitolerans DSM 16785]